MKAFDIPKSGKCGDRVWQRNRFCQYSYAAFVPFNPRSPAQVTVRERFRAVSARWRTLNQEQRDVWIAVAWTKWSKPRLGCGRLTGFNFFVKVNVGLVNQGKPQVDLPMEGRSKKAECRKTPERAVSGLRGEGFVSKQEPRREPLDILTHVMPKNVVRTRSTASHSFRGRLGTRWNASLPSPQAGSGAGGTRLRYRSCTGVSPYHHRSSTLVGRCTLLRSQNRLRLPCRSPPPRCRSATRGVCRAGT